MKVKLPGNGWKPRKYQLPLWNYLENGGKRAVAVWHRRAGKDDCCLHRTCIAAMERPANYWHMLPEASQARKAVWDAVNPRTGKRRIDEAFPAELRVNTRDQDMSIKFINGAMWQVIGSDNYNSLVGSPPAGVVFSEWAKAKPDAWAYLRPILADNNGWAFFIYTPRGPNHGKTTYEYAKSDPEHWFAELLTVEDTDVFDQETLKREKEELCAQYGASRGEAFFMQEYYCSFTQAFTGKTVYPEFNHKQHVSFDPLLPLAQDGIRAGRSIIRGWDNTGLSPACVLTYLTTTGQWLVFKEFCGNDVDIVSFTEGVQVWCNEYLEGAKFSDYGDPASKIRDTSKKSAYDYMYEQCGIKVEDGIQTFKIRRSAVSQRLLKLVGNAEPAILIDAIGCPVLIDGFSGGYGYQEMSIPGIFSKDPVKNEYSHPHDALQYIATKLFATSPIVDPREAAIINMKRQAHIERKDCAYI